MFGVYEVYTWDDVNYIKVDEFEKKEDADNKCKELNEERRSHHYVPDPICYSVMSDIEYYKLMHD